MVVVVAIVKAATIKPLAVVVVVVVVVLVVVVVDVVVVVTCTCVRTTCPSIYILINVLLNIF